MFFTVGLYQRSRGGSRCSHPLLQDELATSAVAVESLHLDKLAMYSNLVLVYHWSLSLFSRTLTIIGHPCIREQDHYSSPEVICPHSTLLGSHRKVGGELLQYSQRTVTC